MTDCKNCKYTDEYCASGDCNKIQANDLACNKISLTEQWKKGELPEGYYYIKTHNETNIDEYIQWYKDHGIPSEKSFAYFNVQQVLALVPSYEKWQAKLEENTKLKERNDSLNNRDINLCRIANGIRDENYKLKNIITEMCCQLVDDDDDMSLGLAEYFDQDLLIEIREALK